MLLIIHTESKTQDLEREKARSSSDTRPPGSRASPSPHRRVLSSGKNAQNPPATQHMQPIVPLDLDEAEGNHHIARADTMQILQNQTRRQPTATGRSRDLLPWEYDIYASAWFGILVILIMFAVSGYFLVLVVIQATGSLLQAGDIWFSGGGYGFAYCAVVPASIILYLWFQVAILSSSIWAPVRHIRRRR